METNPIEPKKTVMLAIAEEVMVEDLTGGVYRVNGAVTVGASKMLAAVAAALGIEPKPRAPREKAAKPAKEPKTKP